MSTPGFIPDDGKSKLSAAKSRCVGLHGGAFEYSVYDSCNGAQLCCTYAWSAACGSNKVPVDPSRAGHFNADLNHLYSRWMRNCDF